MGADVLVQVDAHVAMSTALSVFNESWVMQLLSLTRVYSCTYSCVKSSFSTSFVKLTGFCNAGKQLAVRPVLEATNSDTHGWSLGASDGDHNVRLDAMDEGLTRLVASLPSGNAESKGNGVANQGPLAK